MKNERLVGNNLYCLDFSKNEKVSNLYSHLKIYKNVLKLKTFEDLIKLKRCSASNLNS